MRLFLLAFIVGAFFIYAILGVAANALQLETETLYPRSSDRPVPSGTTSGQPTGAAGKRGDLTETRVRQIVREELRKQFNAVRYPMLPEPRGGN